jgi:hypothetical protein
VCEGYAAHKTRYTSRVAAAVAAAKKVCDDAERLAAPERAGEGAAAGVLESLPVAAAAGDPEGVPVAAAAGDSDGVSDGGDCPKNGAPADGAGTETAWKFVSRLNRKDKVLGILSGIDMK